MRKKKPSRIQHRASRGPANRLLLSVNTWESAATTRHTKASHQTSGRSRYYLKICPPSLPTICEIIQNHSQFLFLCKHITCFFFWPSLQDCSCRQRRPIQSTSVGYRPPFCWPFSPGQNQHRCDPAPAAGPAHAHGEPELHCAGGAAGTRGQREDPRMWRLQQNHQVGTDSYCTMMFNEKKKKKKSLHLSNLAKEVTDQFRHFITNAVSSSN